MHRQQAEPQVPQCTLDIAVLVELMSIHFLIKLEMQRKHAEPQFPAHIQPLVQTKDCSAKRKAQ